MARNEIREGYFQHFVESIESLERGEKQKDLAEDAERALYYATKAFNKRAEMIEQVRPNAVPAVETERKLFEQSLRTAQAKLDKRNRINKQLIDRLVSDIETSFFQDPAANGLMEQTFYRLLDKDVPRTDEGEPLETWYSNQHEYFDSPYVVLESPQSFGLDKAPYGQRVINRAFENAINNGEYYYAGSSYFNTANVENYEELLWRAVRGIMRMEDPSQRLRLLKQMDTTSRLKPEKSPHQGAIVYAYFDSKATSRVLDWVGPTFLRDSMFEAAEKEPTDFFYSSRDLKDYPDYGEAAIVAFNNIEASYRLGYLDEVKPYIKTQDELKGLVRKTLDKVMESNPDKIYSQMLPTVQSVLSPEECSFYIKKAALLDPEGALDAHDKLRKFPDGVRILQKAANLLLERDYKKAMDIFIYQQAIPWPADYKARLIEHGISYYPDILYSYQTHWRKLSDDPEWKQAFEAAKKNVDRFEQKRSEMVNLLLKTITDGRVSKQYGGGPRRLRDELRADPALAKYPLVDLAWLPIPNREVAIQTAVMVLRNMHIQKIGFNEANFKEAYQKLEMARAHWTNVPLLEGRHVLLVSHSETYRDLEDYKTEPEKDRFGSPALTRDVQKKQGTGTRFEHIEPKKGSFESTKLKKEAALKAIVDFPSPMTFIFDGHGGERALYLSDGQISGTTVNGPMETEKTIKISVVELAEAFKRRQEAGKDVSKDILINGGCSSHVFALNFYEELKKLNCKQPVVVAVSEYGQYAFSNYDSRYGSDFWDFMLKQSRPSFGSFWPLTPVDHHNPTIFIPSDKGPMQLAAAESEDSEALG